LAVIKPATRCGNISFDYLPNDWASRETHTQTLGDAWLKECTELILVVPSVIMPIAAAPDRNVLINHRHPSSDRITITAVTPFTFDPRLFQP
jgi:RES domain-containing protein